MWDDRTTGAHFNRSSSFDTDRPPASSLQMYMPDVSPEALNAILLTSPAFTSPANRPSTSRPRRS